MYQSLKYYHYIDKVLNYNSINKLHYIDKVLNYNSINKLKRHNRKVLLTIISIVLLILTLKILILY